MAMNRVQFQQGMSLHEFMQDFGTEVQCALALEKARWPTGFHCPACDWTGHYRVRHGSRTVAAVRRLPAPDFADRWHGAGRHQTATEDLVSGDADQPGQDRLVGPGLEALPGGELPHRLVGAAQVDGHDFPGGRPGAAARPGAA